jgi:7-keto-8-aminopelargonate synthetase-like enzyme
MATLGKALGCQGGVVAGPRALIAMLHNRARTFIYATALSPAVTAAALEGLRVVREQPELRGRLDSRVRAFRQRVADLPAIPADPASHIVPIVVETSAAALELSAFLLERGMLAPAIRPPTVPEGAARLRLSLTALHADEQLEEMAHALGDWFAASPLAVDGSRSS